MALQIITEAERCLNCKNPMCQKGCPVGTPIPHLISLLVKDAKVTAEAMIRYMEEKGGE